MATYYLDFANGNDTTGDGSTGTPWKTLSKFLTACANGDTCKVRGSDTAAQWYRLTAVVSTSKTSLTIEADTGHSPVFIASTQLTSWALSGGYSYTYEATCSKSWGVAYNGSTALTVVASVAAVEATENSSYLTGGKLYVHIAGGGAPTSIEALGDATLSALLTCSGTGLTLRGVTFRHTSFGLSLTGANATVTGCTFERWGSWSPVAVSVGTTGVTVTGCSFTNFRTASAAHNAIKAVSGAGSLTVTGCTFYGGGIQINMTTGTGHVVENCVQTFPAHCQQIWSGNASGTVTGCQLINGCYGSIRGDVAHTGTVTVKRCVFYHGPSSWPDGVNMKTGVHLHGADSSWNVYHCTFAYQSKGDTEGTGHGIYCVPDSAKTVYLTVKNCVIFDAWTGIAAGTSPAPTLTLDYNCYYSNNADFSNVAGGDQGTHNVTSNPLFLNGAARDLHLVGGSPCRNAGVAVPGINDDYKGSAPDIGAYEVTGGRQPFAPFGRLLGA